MTKIKSAKMPTNVQLLLFILALLLFYFLLNPILNIFLTSVVLTYVFYPVYSWIKKRINYNSLSILATLAIIILLFLMPFVFVASQIPNQVVTIYSYAKDNFAGKNIFDGRCKNAETLSCKTLNFLTGSGFFKFEEIVNTLFKKISEAATYIVVKIPNSIAAAAISLFISFFLFKDGKGLFSKIISMLPVSKNHADNLVKKFGSVTYSVVYAHIIAAIAQGILGMIGFYIFGVPSAIFWGVVMSIFALIPMIGPAIIWIPAALLQIISGIATNSYWSIGMGIGILLYGLFVISTADNLLRVKIIGSSSDVHPLTVVIGIIGGINLFGLSGIFIGPIILSLLLTYFEDFAKSYS